MAIWQRTVSYQWSASTERQAHDIWEGEGPECGAGVSVMAVSEIEQVSTAYAERQLDGTIAIRDLDLEDHELIIAALTELATRAAEDQATQVLMLRANRLLPRIDAPAS